MLRLRPYRTGDAGAVVSWTGDERAFRQWCADRFDWYPVTAEELDRQYGAMAGSGRFFPMTALDETGPVGHLILRFADEGKTVIRFGFVIVDPEKRGRGIGREMLRLAARYAFEFLGAEKVTLGVFENNGPAIRCYRAAGFRETADAPASYAILNETWKCLEMELSRSAFQTNEYTENERKRRMIIETDRLLITELTMDMAQAVHENSLDEDNRRFVPDEVFETPEEAGETIAYLTARYGALDGPQVYAVIVREGDLNAGYVQMVPIGEGRWEIGYHIAKRYTCRGYATEAVRAFLPVMADRIGIREVDGICLKENAASCRVLSKCGFETLYTGPGPYQGSEREIVKTVWRA